MHTQANSSYSNPTVISMGEVMIRLSPRFPEHLARAATLDIQIGGTEANFLVSLQQLGIQTGWVGRLPKNVLGRRVLEEMRRYGVNVDGVVWDEENPLGIMFYQHSARPRSDFVYYHRAGSAASHLQPADIDWDFLTTAKHVHLTGITMALSDSCRKVVERAVEICNEKAVSLSFDVNYREKLWSPETARKAMAPVLPGIDLLILTQEDASRVFLVTGNPEEVCKEMMGRYGVTSVCVTLGDEGSVAYDGTDFYYGRAYDVETVDKIGGGDTFAAGLVYGFLNDDLQMGVDYGGAMAALKLTFPGDMNYFSREEVEELLSGKHSSGVRR